ncbi:MAG: restriction endonuclease [Proteobacteria bacterium]|nr:restriction endonuclease [Pseudomonadota bacterium]
MFDVFTEEIEILVKDGIANLYWYKGDLHKAWLRSGVVNSVKDEIIRLKSDDGQEFSKRRQMDFLYERLRNGEYNRRLEVSRNFVRILIEQKTFTPQNEKHRIEVAERCALKLREILRQQQEDQEYLDSIRTSAAKATKETYDSKLGELREKFAEAHELSPQKKGYALEKLFTELMRISGIPVEEPFRIEGEQFDGAIKYDGHFYLVELKWTAEKTEPKEVGHFFFKVDGKLEARGLFIAMNGFSDGTISTLPMGKKLKVMLLDGNHLANVIYGHYKFQELLEHAIRQASLRGEIYCAHNFQS